MNRFLAVYAAICLLYAAVFVWLVAPEVGFLETEFDIGAMIPLPIGWALMTVLLLYVVARAPANARLLRMVSEKRISRLRASVLAAAFVLVPGSMGIVLYFVTANPYVSLPLECLMISLTVYYYRHLSRLMSDQIRSGSFG